jgi:hypothetical protein
MMELTGKRIVVTGGAGFLIKMMVRADEEDVRDAIAGRAPRM